MAHLRAGQRFTATLLLSLLLLFSLPHRSSQSESPMCTPRPFRPFDEHTPNGSSSATIFCNGYGPCCSRKADSRVRLEASIAFSSSANCGSVWSELECATVCSLNSAATACPQACSNLAYHCGNAPVKLDDLRRAVPCSVDEDIVCVTLSALAHSLNVTACGAAGFHPSEHALCPSEQQRVEQQKQRQSSGSSARGSKGAQPESSGSSSTSRYTQERSPPPRSKEEKKNQSSTSKRDSPQQTKSGASKQSLKRPLLSSLRATLPSQSSNAGTLVSAALLFAIVFGIIRLIKFLRRNQGSINRMGVLSPLKARRLA